MKKPMQIDITIIFSIFLIIGLFTYRSVKQTSEENDFPVLPGSYETGVFGTTYYVCENALNGEKIYKKMIECGGDDGCGQLLYDANGQKLEPTKKTKCDAVVSFNCSLQYEIETIKCLRTTEDYFEKKIKQH